MGGNRLVLVWIARKHGPTRSQCLQHQVVRGRRLWGCYPCRSDREQGESSAHALFHHSFGPRRGLESDIFFAVCQVDGHIGAMSCLLIECLDVRAAIRAVRQSCSDNAPRTTPTEVDLRTVPDTTATDHHSRSVPSICSCRSMNWIISAGSCRLLLHVSGSCAEMPECLQQGRCGTRHAPRVMVCLAVAPSGSQQGFGRLSVLVDPVLVPVPEIPGLHSGTRV